ncbi:helix-turn-helix domain-containing protein [Flavobacterium croceum]|uniref:DNA-binding XRE family transcriptional regulator n=1 Tax=Flavobacterium croceum DSM 17960 TaxID=1121886 RepID=A0A2S4N5R0_9FLAO|nr:helix-turn-helix transcriptional regulator [Flavobacterium croceum]POS01010.1 DNA-binding XRE family transcriptional regulator [Flavobacterium croceum DSM 17960]
MENIIEKIKDIRKSKGYSHEYMAHKLEMSQPAYSKIEKNETVLSVDRLFKIAEILETSVIDILDINPNTIYNQTNNDNATFIGHQQVEHLYQDNKEKSEKIEQLYLSRLKDKDAMIEQLQKLLEKYLK